MKEWLIKHTVEIAIVFIIAGIVGLGVIAVNFKPQRPAAVITELASGKLLNIEIQTGWNTDAILRFDDGSVIKIAYWHVQRRSMKEGRHYIVRHSSIDGLKVILVKYRDGEQNEKL